MRCIECGADTHSDETICSRCRGAANVQILTQRERESFDGVTIEQDGFGQESPGYKNQYGHNHRVYVRHVQFGSVGLLTKIIIAALLALLIMVALPLALFALVTGIVWYFLRRR